MPWRPKVPLGPSGACLAPQCGPYTPALLLYCVGWGLGGAALTAVALRAAEGCSWGLALPLCAEAASTSTLALGAGGRGQGAVELLLHTAALQGPGGSGTPLVPCHVAEGMHVSVCGWLPRSSPRPLFFGFVGCSCGSDRTRTYVSVRVGGYMWMHQCAQSTCLFLVLRAFFVLASSALPCAC